MLNFEVTHSGRVYREIASLGYNIISVNIMVLKERFPGLPVATERADARNKESCMVDMRLVEAKCAPGVD